MQPAVETCMDQQRLHARTGLLERGRISFFQRPPLDADHARKTTVQRLLMLLEPDSGPMYRLIAIGRKHSGESQAGRKFWGFVDLVLTDRRDMDSVLDTHFYQTPTSGVLPVPAAVPIGSGRYVIQREDGDAHLVYSLEPGAAIEPTGDFVIDIANPDPAAWGLAEPSDLQREIFAEPEIHAQVHAPLPHHLQKRFRGRPCASLDTTDWIDQPGAELLFTSGAG